jgi:hypothetical protein
LNEIIGIAQEIKIKIGLLEKMRVEIRNRAEQKAIKGAEYDRALALTILKLKNGAVIDLDGEPVEGKKLPANLIDRVARGICWREKLEADKAEALYKSLISNIDSVQAEMNGLQSINRHID